MYAISSKLLLEYLQNTLPHAMVEFSSSLFFVNYETLDYPVLIKELDNACIICFPLNPMNLLNLIEKIY